MDKLKFVPGVVTATLDAAAFVVRESEKPFHGFIRAASDHRHLEFTDGTFFYPIGPCVRSPSDSRIPYDDPKWNPAEIDRIGKRGTYQFDEYFTEFERAGINWARVWMCSWWGSLEWRRDWPGYQGVGRYNLLNAWRIDHVIQEAEKKGIAINLCLTNHGQYSLFIDTEWRNNPYNAKLGGPLAAPDQFFTEADPKIAHQNKLRYVVARYGHSPAIMAWALFSELEFTEEYFPSYMREAKRPPVNVDDWHAEMARFVEENDPNHHLVTTHYSHPERGTTTFKLPELGMATSNAYSAFCELAETPSQTPDGATSRCDAAAALDSFWSGNALLKGFHVYNKPALVEEQGRHWMGVEPDGTVRNTKEQLDADLHAGLWGSMVQPLAGATGYWWWLHLHFDKRYQEYTALRRFMEGEDLRPIDGETPLEPVYRTIKSKDNCLRGRALRSERRAYIWIYHENMPLAEPAPVIDGAELQIGGLGPGTYSVEFWNTYTGKMTDKREVTVEKSEGGKTSLQMPLPPVDRDLAVKIKTKKP